jgi:vacuolar-type H+-ATPase subunit I/STV1
MLNTILKYGLIAGVIVGTFMGVSTTAMLDNPPPGWVGMLIGYTSMLVALSFVFVGVKRHRDEALGGVIGFWPAFGIGIGISLVAGVLYALAWEVTLAVTGMDYGAVWTKHMVAEAQAAGKSAAEIAKIRADMAVFEAQYRNPLYRLPMTFTEIAPVGLLVSLVSAALLRNRNFAPAR